MISVLGKQTKPRGGGYFTLSTYYVAGVPYSSELYHHGIKGQRWGIRRFQNPDGSLTNAGRMRYGVSTEQAIQSLRKGSTVWRSSVNANEDEKGHAYVSTTAVDRDHYRGGEGAKWLKNTSGDSNANIYESEYRFKRDPKVADRNAVLEVYEQLRKKDKSIDKAVVDDWAKKQTKEATYYNREALDAYKKNADTLIAKVGEKKYKELVKENEQAIKEVYKQYVAKMEASMKSMSVGDIFDGAASRSFGSSPYVREKITKELKKRGYDAMIDQASIGTRTMKEGVAPVIVFVRADLLEKVSTRQVTDREQEKYGKKYSKWKTKESNRALKDYYRSTRK